MTDSVESAMDAFSPKLPLAVAFSGGADSTALLLACVERWPDQVIAVHVNHGLQAAASQFESHCEAMCRQWKVPLTVCRVDARHAHGESPEAAARNARYTAFGALRHVKHAQSAIQTVAIAQHADDQVETLLLALSRGSGVAGLAAMPKSWVFDGLVFQRPLLEVSSTTIRRWLAERRAEFVEDPTNANENFTRNRIRAHVLPALEKAFPHFLDTFGRSATHAAQAQVLLDELAGEDLQRVCGDANGAPSIKRLRALTRARQGNVLRYWLKLTHRAIPSTAQLNELLDQLRACATRGHGIDIKVGPGYVRRRGDALHWYNS